MPDDPHTSGESFAEAERILAAFLEALKAGQPVDTAQLCAEHPERAEELEALYEKWLSASGVLEQVDVRRSQVAQAVARANPKITLGQPGTGSGQMLLDKLAASVPGANRYEIQEEIDRGGMGAILRIWDKDLRRELAMKVMLGQEGSIGANVAVDGVPLGRFLEEAQVTGQLDHPGVVPVHELGIDADGRVFFTMRLVKGQTLSSALELLRTGAEGWTQTRALGVLLKVCEAMSYAHSKGVVHRDLKPANIMVGRFGEVYVMDWGLSRVLGQHDRKDIRLKVPAAKTGSLKTVRRDAQHDTPDSPLVTMDGDVVGTPSFMAPEQARGQLEQVDRRSDVYSVGSMLYQLLTGQMPYVPEGARVSAYTVLAAVLQGSPTAVDKIAPGMPAELVAICEKAMSRDPADRYADMLEMAEDLRAFVEHRVVQAYQTGPWAEARKWVRRNRALAASMLATLAVGAAGLGLTAWTQREARLEQAALNEQTAQARDEAESVAVFLESLFEPFGAALGADSSWHEDMRAEDLLDRGRERLAADQSGTAARWRLLQSLGRTYRYLGRYGTSQELLSEAYELTRAEFGEESHRGLSLRLELGHTQLEAQEWIEAEATLREVVRQMAAHLGAKDAETIRAQLVLGQVLARRASPDAEAHLRETLRVAQSALAATDPVLTDALGALADTLWEVGKVEEGVKLFEKAAAARRLRLGPDHPDTMTLHNNLALAYSSLGENARAEELLQGVVDSRMELFGADHPETLNARVNLAQTYVRQARVDDAERTLVDAIQRLRKVVEPTDRRLVAALMNLAGAHLGQKRYGEAEELFREAAERYTESLALDHPSTLRAVHNRAYALYKLRRYEDALELFDGCAQRKEQVLGVEHVDTWTSQKMLGLAYAKLGRLEEAIVAYERLIGWVPEDHEYRAGYEATLGKLKKDV